MIKLTRRSFLATLSLLPASYYANAAVRQSKQGLHETYNKKVLRRRINSVIGSWQSVSMVGKHYNQATSMTDLSPWTPRFIHKLIDSTSSTDRKTIKALRNSYQCRVREDFSHNRIACVNGYILSKSEAETCWLLQKMLYEGFTHKTIAA